MTFQKIILFLLITLSLSCAKEMDESEIIEDNPPQLVMKIETNLLVIVSKSSTANDRSAICIINEQEYQSDENGIIDIKNILLNERGNSLTIKSEGYFDEIRFVIPALGQNLYLEVDMSTLQEIDGFDSEQGSVLEKGNVSIDIPARALEDINGNEYIGQTRVWLMKRSSSLFSNEIRQFQHNQFIGENNSSSLNIFGGIHLLIEDMESNRLYLKSGKSATIEMKIESCCNLEIPDKLEVWTYDSTFENWEFLNEIESLGESINTCKVNNFGNIVWADPIESRLVKVSLKTTSGEALRNTLIFVFISRDYPSYLSYTDNSGIAHLYVPTDREYLLTSLITCGQQLKSQEYPMITNTSSKVLNIPDFIINDSLFVNIKGSTADCNNSPVTGYVKVNGNSLKQFIPLNEEGSFNITIPSGSINIRIYDQNTMQFSETVKIEEAEPEIDFGEIKVCE